MTGSGRGWRSRVVASALIRQPWVVYAGLTLLTFPILESLLFGTNALHYSHDVFDDDVPRLYAIAADQRAMGFSLWFSHMLSGNSLFTSFALSPLSPDVAVSFVAPPYVAYLVTAGIIAFLAGLGMHLFVRDTLRLPAIAAYSAGVLATTGFWHYIYGVGAPLLPMLAWASLRAASPAAARAEVGRAALIVAFGLVAGQVQLIALDALVVAALVVAGADSRREAARRLVRIARSWLLGVGLAAPVVLSLVIGIADSQRSIWVLDAPTPIQALGDAFTRYSAILFAVPVLPGLGGTADIYGSFFVGVAGLLLLVGVRVGSRTRMERALLAGLLLLPVADVIASVLTPVLAEVGPLRSFQFVRIRHLMPFFLVANVAVAVASWVPARSDGLLPPRVPDGAWRAMRWLGPVVIGVALIWQLAVVAGGALDSRGVPRLGWVAIFIGLTLGVGLVALLTVGPSRVRWRGVATDRWLGAALVVGIAVVQLVHSRGERWLSGHLGTWERDVAPSAAARFIAAQPGFGRVISVGEDANRAMTAGLKSVDGYSVVYPLRYHQLFRLLIAPGLAKDPSWARYYDTWGNRAYAFRPELDPEIGRLLGVRWRYVRGEPLDEPSLLLRYEAGGTRVYEDPAVFPHAFLVGRVVRVDDVAAAGAALANADDAALRATAWVVEGDAPPGSAAAAAIASLEGPSALEDGDGLGNARIVRDDGDRVEISVTAPARSLLVLADTYASGWSVAVDGSDASILPVDLALRGVPVPTGNHTVTFRYRPLAPIAGFAVSAASAFAMAAWVWLGRRRRRPVQRRMPPPIAFHTSTTSLPPTGSSR